MYDYRQACFLSVCVFVNLYIITFVCALLTTDNSTVNRRCIYESNLKYEAVNYIIHHLNTCWYSVYRRIIRAQSVHNDAPSFRIIRLCDFFCWLSCYLLLSQCCCGRSSTFACCECGGYDSVIRFYWWLIMKNGLNQMIGIILLRETRPIR